MFSGFQPSSYQHSAYQIVVVAVKQEATPGYSWERTKREYERQQRKYLEDQKRLKETKELVSNKEAELAALEAKRLEDLADQKMQLELIALMKELQRLEQERLELEAAIRFFLLEEDAIIALLYSMPFVT